ncbi:hypothetical protein M413DRAFT_445667 [Hebeloma cylindrosporum]|uniref:Uncharacterized protein n=1 Tax=Hebeloma cylindrosporum TaxID=76867 RepID=A0A0C3BW99_HEBCY|nr:hypothetical protein M413DRAFT_445667 [Hebeloma cylindrosporum h7]
MPKNAFPRGGTSSISPERLSGITVSFESTPRTGLFPPKSNEIYENHLLLKGRGFPLWIPEPNRRLPLAYRREGVNIGDVGTITQFGAFSFLFNICVPHDNPINPRVLPEDFVPISPRLESLDIAEYVVFKAGSHLASASIEHSTNKSEPPGLLFETSASEGAILTMPVGAVSHDLENVIAFSDYVAANAYKWYKFAFSVRGRKVENGQIRLVTGCDKAKSWGMAVLSNMSQERRSQLKFRALGDTKGTYTWEYSGMAEVRVGPDISEIMELRDNEGDSVDASRRTDEEFSNQCLFVRTLNATLNDNVWGELTDSLGLGTVLNSSPASGAVLEPSAANRHVGSSSSHNQQPSNATQITGTQRSLLPEYSLEDSTSGKDVTISTTPEFVALNHPSNGLNKLLLQKFPRCRMVISHDEDWCSALEMREETFPDPANLLERIMVSRNIRIENDVLFLDWKEGESGDGTTIAGDSLYASSLAGSETTLSRPMFPARGRTVDDYSPEANFNPARSQHVAVLGAHVKKLEEIEELSSVEDEDELARSDTWLGTPLKPNSDSMAQMSDAEGEISDGSEP